MAYAGAEIERLLVRISADASELRKELGGALESVKGMAASAVDSVKGLGTLFATAVAAPMAALAAAAGGTAASFEKEMSKIQGLAGASKEQLEGYKKAVLEMGPALGKAPEELAKGLYFVVSGGLSGKEALDALRVSAMASAAGLGEMDVVARVLKASVNAYSSTNLTAAQAADVLAAAVQNSKLSAEALAPVISRVAPLASTLGVSMGEALGPLAAMTRTGASAAEAATSLQAFFSTLIKPAKQSRAMLESYGITFQQLRDQVKGEGGVVGVMRMLDKAFKGNQEAMARVFPNIRALRGVLSLLSQDGAKVSDILDKVRNPAGALGVAFGAVAGTAAFAASQLKAGLTTALAELGNYVLEAAAPAMRALNNAVQAGLEWWRALSDETKQTVVRYMGLTAAIGAALIAVKAVSLAVGLLGVKQLAASALAAAWATSVLLVKGAMLGLTATLGLVKLAISGQLVLGALYKAYLLIATAVTWAWVAAQTALNFVLAPATLAAAVAGVVILGAAFLVAKAAVEAVWAAGSELLDVLGDFDFAAGPVAHVGDLFKEWGGILKDVWETVQTDAPGAFRILAAGAALAFNQVRDMLPPLWAFIKEGFSAAWDVASETLIARLDEALELAKIRVKEIANAGVNKEFDDELEQERQMIQNITAWKIEAANKEAKGRLDALAAGWKVEESEATRAARASLDAVRGEVVGYQGDMRGAVDAYHMERLTMMGPFQEAKKGAQEAAQTVGGQLVPQLKAARKELEQIQAAGYGSAEALGRISAFREAVAKGVVTAEGDGGKDPQLEESKKQTELLKQIADHPQVEVEGMELEDW